MMNKKTIGIILGAVLVLAGVCAPAPAGLTKAGLMAMVLFAGAVVMWLTESLPLSVTGLGVMVLMVLFSVYSMEDAYDAFADTAFFFVFATYAIKACLVETTIPDRICSFFIRMARGNSKLFVFGIMMATASISAIMSNMATCALFSALALKFLEINHSGKDSRLAKCLMLGIPVACGAGGFATLAGTPANMIAVNLLETNIGITVRFLDWALIGIPMALICVTAAALILTAVLKPEPLSQEISDYALNLKHKIGSLKSHEKKTVMLIAVEIVLWLATTWIPWLNTTSVAILCMAVMFMPHMNLLDWKTFSRNVNYDALFMLGSITALVGGLTSSGATKWLVDTIVPDMSGKSLALVFLTCSLIAAVVHMVIPSGSPAFMLAAVPMLGIAMEAGVSGAALMLMAAFWSGETYLLPFDGVYLLTYSTGFYKINDMAKTGIVLYIIMIPLVAVVVPLLCMLLGM